MTLRRERRPTRAHMWMSRRILATALTLLAAGPAGAQDGPPGITAPIVLPPFVRDTPVCSAPPGLSRELAFAQDNEREFMQGVSRGLALAARDRGLAYRILLANNNAAN
jgi:ribose transport system substrate-binding protein